jgi:hypothetical protein
MNIWDFQTAKYMAYDGFVDGIQGTEFKSAIIGGSGTFLGTIEEEEY